MADVPELLALKYENGVLKLQQLQLRAHQINADAAAIQTTQTEILGAMRASVGAGADDSYNVQTRQFVPVPKPQGDQSKPVKKPTKLRALG